MNKNIKRAFLKLAIILLTFNLVLTSFYPFFISPGVIYAQSEEDYWAADAALSAETAETQPADIPPEQPEQVDSCQTYGEGCGEPVAPAPESSEPACTGTPRDYNECVGCLRSRPVHQDSCGNYSSGGEQDDSACTSGCAAEVGPATAGAPSETAEEAAPEPTAEPVVDQSYQWADYALTDSYTQEQALDTYETRVYDAMSTQAEAEVEQRQEEDNSWDLAYYATQTGDSIPETVVDTIDNTAEAVESARLQAGQAWNDFYVSKVSEDKELQKKADEAQAEVDKRDNEFAQNLAQAEDELEKKAPGYSWDNYQADNEQAKVVLQAVEALGGKVEGTPADFTFVLPESCMIDPSLCAAASLEWANTSKNEDVANFVTMGGYDIGKKALNLKNEWEELEKQRQEAGIAGVNEPGGVPQYKGYNIGDVPYDPMYAQTNNYMDAIKADLVKRPDASLTEEQKALRDKYLDGIEQFNKEGTDLTLETTAWALMNTVGGPVTEIVIKGGVAAAKPLVIPVVKKTGSFLEPVTGLVSDGARAVYKRAGDLFSGGVKKEATEDLTGQVVNALDNKDPVFVRSGGLRTQAAEVGSGMVGQAVEADRDIKALEVKDVFLEAQRLIKEIFGREGTEDEIQGIAVRLGDAIQEGQQGKELIRASMVRAKRYTDFLTNGSSSGLSPEEAGVISNKLRIVGSFSDDEMGRLVDNPDEMAGRVAEIISQSEMDAQKVSLDNLVSRVNLQMRDLDDYLVKYHPKKLPPRDFQVTSDQFHIINSNQMKELTGGREDVGGLAMNNGQVAVNRNVFDKGVFNDEVTSISLLAHETCHQCVMEEIPRNLAGLQRVFSEDNALKLNEALTEFYTDFFSENALLKNAFRSNQRIGYSKESAKTVGKHVFVSGEDVSMTENIGFPAQAVAVHNEIVPAIMKNKKVSFEQANAIVLGASRDGRYGELMDAVGGQDALTKILDSLPSTHPDVSKDASQVLKVGRVVTPVDQKKAVIQALAVVGGPGAIGIGAVHFLNESQKSNQPQLLPWRLIEDAHAADSQQKDYLPTVSSFEILVKQQLVKNALIEEGQVDSSFVREVLEMEILKPEVEEIKNDYFLTTGKAGSVEANIKKDKYKVIIDSLPGVDIEVPAIVDLSKDDIIVPIKVKQGSGQVKKGVVYADSAEQNKVKVVVVSDKGDVLPWAGLNIKLEKVDQEKVINLNAGWNLVTLPALPNQPLSASALLDQINAQGGEAVAVSSLEDGAWKTYVKRGDKDYSDSADNFVIEPGKAYFIKALKPVKFSFVGQNLVKPIKLKLTSGWNAVGFPKTSKSYNAMDLPVDSLARWQVGLWDTLVKKDQQQYGHNFNILNTQGYILKVGKVGEFSP